jgi:rare lipoprotein A
MRILAATLALALMTAPAASACLASWYGSESGSRTANGERFDPGGLSAAHRSLPFGARLRVTYAGRSVIVRVTDRGPFIRGRCLDLSRGAAEALGIIGRGTARVSIQRLR